MGRLELKNVILDQHLLSRVEELYYNSFPPEERRPWNSVKSLLKREDIRYKIEVIQQNGKFVGFISSWDFGSFCYVEHFAVESSVRGNGIGAAAISQFVAKSQKGVVLEVELPHCGEMAQRRIGFYNRNGFIAHSDFEYIQPSYGEGLPSVPMLLMSANMGDDLKISVVAKTILRFVYGVKKD